MKLYISYYDNYISIVEGIYNIKKDKYNIKNAMFLSSEDIEIDTNDKYGLLREALRLNKFKSKDVVFSLNTRDVIIKQNHIPKANPKDLDGIMNNEMYEMMSLDYEEYTFSYEVTDEKNIDNKDILDVILAAIPNDELDLILSIFKEFKLNIERIDTMSTAYARLLKKVQYEDIMMLNIGSYGSSVNIYKEDSLFIHDSIPVRINQHANYSVSLALVDEVKGLMNFYSSRNFGKNIDTLVVVGESNNNEIVIDSFKDAFNCSIVSGIENLFDIENDIQGDLQQDEISKACDILGSMSISENKKGYAYMNLLPLELRNKQKKMNLVKQGLIAVPLVVGVLASPIILIATMNMKVEHETKVAQAKLDEIKLEYKGIENIDNEIKKAQEELGIYDMLSSKDVKWGSIMNAIDKNIPYKADLANISVYYDSTLDEIEVEKSSEQNDEEIQETPIYDQVPNTIELEGVASTPDKIGQFVYGLNKSGYFKSVELKSSAEDKENGGYTFHIVLEVIKDAVSS